MKIIINERQLRQIIESEKKISDRKLKMYKATIDDVGVDKALELLGVKMYQFFDVGVIDFNDYPPFELFPVLVEMQKEYKGCEINVDWFSENSYGVYWAPNFKIGEYLIGCATMALPEFNEGKVYVENAHCWIEKNGGRPEDFNNGFDYNVKTIDFDIPSEFESWDVMVEWYKTKYMPNVYKIMKEQAKETIKQLKRTEMIDFIDINTTYKRQDIINMIESGERDLVDFYLEIVGGKKNW